MSKITDDYDDYKDGLSYIEDYEHTGWRGKITIKKPRIIENIQPNKPIDFFFSFFEKETRSSSNNGRPLKPSRWCVTADVPFIAGSEKVIITESIIIDESEQEYYRNIRFNKNLQKKYINDALEKALSAFEKFFLEKGKGFVPDEDFNREVYYLDSIEITNPEYEVKIDDLKIRKERLINFIERELYDVNLYKTMGYDLFYDGQWLDSFWSKDEAEHELMLLKKADYFMTEDYCHQYFDTEEEAETFRKLIFINHFLGEGPEAIMSRDNIIRVAKFREDRIKKYRKNIEKYLETCD